MSEANHTLESLRASPNSLAAHYRRFRVSERLLLTGHSHQAWPDCAREAMLSSFDDAAARVDDKWQAAFDKAERVRTGIRALLGDSQGHIALGANTHELIVRWLSALPLRERPRLVTTDAEFHSLRRQLDRLAEEGIEVTRVAATPVATLAERLLQAAQADADRTAAVLVSSVLFTTSEIVPHLDELGPPLAARGIALLVDTYHHLGVVPFDMRGLSEAAIVGGGYKYLQLGEGNCFLRFPEQAALRPVITGWFAEFPWLGDAERPSPTPYAPGPDRLAGSTYDPTSHYRAARVLDFFAEQGLHIQLLRQVNQHQTRRLREGVRALDADPSRLALASDAPCDNLAGFVTLRCDRAEALCQELTKREVAVDRRGLLVRLGPAPYLSDAQLDDALLALREAYAALL